MKFARISLVAVVAFVAAGVAAFADDSFEYKGYMRIGTQLNTSGNAPDAWGQAGAQKWTGRLGNEDQARPWQDPFFLEQTFIKNWTHENGSFAKCVVLLNYHGRPTGDTADYVGSQENNSSTPAKANTALRLRQAYVEMGGFGIAPNTTFWVGKRFLNRQDVHILDWFLLDFSGNGAGVTNIANIGLDLAYVQRLADENGSGWTATDGNGRMTSNNIVAKYENSMVRIDGNINFISNGQDKNNKKATYSSQMLSAQYKPEKFFFLLPGQSTVTFQYANGSQANCMFFGNRFTNNVGGFDGWTKNTDSKALCLTAVVTGLAQVNDNLNINPVLVWRYYDLDRTKSDANPDAKWKTQHIVAAVRPTYNFNANVGVALEVAYSMAKTDSDTWSGGPMSWNGMGYKEKDKWASIYKIAPTLILTLDSGYWTRPQLRLGYVYTAGSDGWKASGVNTNKNKSSAQWFFAQAEAWW